VADLLETHLADVGFVRLWTVPTTAMFGPACRVDDQPDGWLLLLRVGYADNQSINEFNPADPVASARPKVRRQTPPAIDPVAERRPTTPTESF
jgi:hypothetical protein